jgi:hypothetical protein
MSLDVGDALREGAEHTVSRNGILLTGLFGIVGLVSLAARDSYLAWVLETGNLPPGSEAVLPANPAPMSLGVPLGVALALWLVTVWATELLRVLTVRLVAADHTDTIPATLLTRRLGWVLVNGFVGTLVAKLLVGVGLVLVVPGVFLAVSLLFVRQVVAVEDARFDEAIARSWTLAQGNRVELFTLCVVWLALWVGVQLTGAVLGAALGGAPAVASGLLVVLTAPLLVFGVAVGSRAYVQVADGTGADATVEDGSGDDEEEWPDPPGVDL